MPRGYYKRKPKPGQPGGRYVGRRKLIWRKHQRNENWSFKRRKK